MHLAVGAVCAGWLQVVTNAIGKLFPGFKMLRLIYYMDLKNDDHLV